MAMSASKNPESGRGRHRRFGADGVGAAAACAAAAPVAIENDARAPAEDRRRPTRESEPVGAAAGSVWVLASAHLRRRFFSPAMSMEFGGRDRAGSFLGCEVFSAEGPLRDHRCVAGLSVSKSFEDGERESVCKSVWDVADGVGGWFEQCGGLAGYEGPNKCIVAREARKSPCQVRKEALS